MPQSHADDARIDALYRLPPSDFITARGVLAKTLTGPSAREVRALKKPTVVPWAVNQVYWRACPIYERVLQEGRALRAAELAALKGHAVDLRSTTEAHRQAISEAVRRAAQLAAAAGLQPDAAPLARMFEALSLAKTHPPTPGRLTGLLQPGGFETLAGVTIAHQPGPEPPPETAKPPQRNAAAPPVAAAGRTREAQRGSATRAEHRTAEAAVKEATRRLERARVTESQARASLDRATSAVRAAEQTLEGARARLDRLDNEG